MGGKLWSRLTLHSKIVLLSTAMLIFTGAILFLIFEYNNPLTMGKMTLYDKIQAAFFNR
jgi:trk system potassium uptake protein TrkH